MVNSFEPARSKLNNHLTLHLDDMQLRSQLVREGNDTAFPSKDGEKQNCIRHLAQKSILVFLKVCSQGHQPSCNVLPIPSKHTYLVDATGQEHGLSVDECSAASGASAKGATANRLSLTDHMTSKLMSLNLVSATFQAIASAQPLEK
jgi:hypothetical protein